MAVAGPGGREVGRVSIRVLPDTSKFAVSLEAYLTRIEHRLELEIPVSLDARSVAQTEAELDLLTRDRNIDIDLDVEGLSRGVGGITRGFARWAPLIAAAAAGLGALVAAVPAAVALIGAPLAAVVLGFEGIKKAASVLKDEFDGLRQSLSDTFERLLTPGFERLADLFPSLERGLGDIALGVSAIFDAFSRAVTTADAMATIERVLSNIGDALSIFAAGGGVDAFVHSLLILSEAGTQASKAITPEFVELFRLFEESLERMAANGDLQKGMEGIGHALLVLAAGIGAIVIVGVVFMAMLERIGEAINTFVTKTIPEGWAAVKTQTIADWKAITSAITGAWAAIKSTITGALSAVAKAISNAWASIRSRTASAWASIRSAIVGAISALPGQLASIGANAAGAFANAITSKLSSLVSQVKSKIADIVAAFKTALHINSPSKVFAEIGSSVGEGFQLGMEKSFRDVTASATLQIAGTVRAASGSSFLSDDFGRRGVDVTQNIYPQPGQSETEIGDAAANRLQFAMARA